jgi:hypothetical protein
MNEKDIHTNTVVLFLVNREFLGKKMSHGMGWDIQKIFRPMGRDECQNFPSHPVPWDGMGPSRPTRSPGRNILVSRKALKRLHPDFNGRMYVWEETFYINCNSYPAPLSKID